MPCTCHEPPFWYLDFETQDLGIDSHHAEVLVHTCRKCGQPWLDYLIEEAHYTKSGRWWRVALAREQREGLTVAGARSLVEGAPWCFVGGSFHDSPGHRVNAPIEVR